mgnify:CR=1 FL=1
MRVLLFANTDWYLYNFRRTLAIALRDAGHDVILASPHGPYGEKLQALGFHWLPVPMERQSLNPWNEARLIWWLREVMQTERVDLVHGFTIKCVVYGAIAARLAGVPAQVSAVAGMGYVFTSQERKARWLRPIVRELLRAVLGGPNSLLILQNPDDVELFEQAKLMPANRIRLIPGSGVDCARFAPTFDVVNKLQNPLGVTKNLKVLLPARLLWDKGVREYVQAAKTLISQGRAIEFLLAGDPDLGNPASVPEQTLQQWVSSGWVHWLGHVDDMIGLLRSVDVVVLPSYREGLPKGLIEAAACEKALITTDVPGCREVVDHEINGLLVPAKDSQALSNAIARFHDDSALRVRLAQAARRKALEVFDERLIIRQTLNVYYELLPPSQLEAL